MPLRRIVFWVHLACGLTAGLVILMMSLTGILLTYEKQMIQWSDRAYWESPADAELKAPLTDIIANARAHDPTSPLAGLIIYADPSAPIAANLGRGRMIYLDPASGQVLGEGTTRVRSFLATVTGWHRWFNAEGDARNGARAITGWSNMIFLFLVLSGLYLWVPRRLSWQHFRPIMLYSRTATGRARDFNWHNVFGFWMSLPLALIVASATVISFPWVSDWVVERGGSGTPGSSAPAPPATVLAGGGTPSLEQLVERAGDRVPGWRTITLNLLTSSESPAEFQIDRGWGGDPTAQTTLMLDRGNGSELSYETFDEQSRGRKLRLFFRYAHTGEYFGLIGQTVAGVASLAGLFLVWSGFALAWRRLVRPLLKKGKMVEPQSEP